MPPPDRLATLDLPLTSREEDGGSSAAVMELLAQHESEALADGKSSEKAPVKGEKSSEKAKAPSPSRATPPFLLSSTSASKADGKDCKGDYVDTAELLRCHVNMGTPDFGTPGPQNYIDLGTLSPNLHRYGDSVPKST